MDRETIALVEGALDDSWQSAQEIADRLHIRATTVREALTRLEVSGKISTHGKKPICFRLREQAENSGSEFRSEYRGEPRPYMRPGSYAPPARPKITLGVVCVPLEAQMTNDATLAISQGPTCAV